MTVFSREMPPVRLAATEYGDDMPRIAARELGDANRWPELVWVNNLSWPFITDDPARVADGVLQSGDFIKIPAPVGVFEGSADTGRVFERDCLMTDRQLRASESGDFEVVSGSANLCQQLQHRVVTPRGQAMRHPDYGSLFYRLIGKINGPAASLLAAEYAKATILSDYRVRSVDAVAATVENDKIKVTARAQAAAGGVVDVVTG